MLRRVRLSLGAFLAAALLSACLASAAAAADWLPSFAVGGTSLSDVRMSADGDIAILVSDGADPALQFRPAGGPLGPLEDPFPAGAESARIDIDAAGNTYLVWVRSGAVEARVRRRDGTLTPIQTLAATPSAGPRVAVSADGLATYAWLTNDANKAVEARTRGADGSLDPVQTVTAAGEKTRSFDLDVAGAGDATFVWVTPDAPPNTKVKARTLAFAGQTLSPILDVSTPAAPELSDSALVAVDPAGNATFVWRHITATFDSLTETRPLSAAGVLGATQILTAVGANSQSHDVAVDDAGNARITWTENTGGPFIPQTCIRAATSSCGALTTVSDNQSLATSVAMGGEGDSIVGLGDGSARVFPRAGGPLALHTLSPTPNLPLPALDDAGDGVAAWSEGSAIKAAGYDAVAPRIDSVTVPATGERGVAVPASASVFDVWGASINWDFGDGGSARGKSVTHRFQKSGTFTVTVTATDGAGATDSETRQITIRDTQPPKLTLSGPRKRSLARKVPVRAVCADEPCALVASGKLIVRKGKRAKSFRLAKARADATAGARTKLKPKLSKRGLEASERALRHGGKAKARVKVLATDAAGNSAVGRRTVRLKLKR